MKLRTRSRYPFYFVLGALSFVSGVFYHPRYYRDLLLIYGLERLYHQDKFYRIGKLQDHFLGKRKLFTFYKKYVHIYDHHHRVKDSHWPGPGVDLNRRGQTLRIFLSDDDLPAGCFTSPGSCAYFPVDFKPGHWPSKHNLASDRVGDAGPEMAG